MYRSFVSLGRYTPKYLILFVAVVNGIVPLIFLSVFSLLVYRNTRDFFFFFFDNQQMSYSFCVSFFFFCGGFCHTLK